MTINSQDILLILCILKHSGREYDLWLVRPGQLSCSKSMCWAGGHAKKVNFTIEDMAVMMQ